MTLAAIQKSRWVIWLAVIIIVVLSAGAGVAAVARLTDSSGGVVIDSIGRQPLTLQEALDSIEAGDTNLLLLQPDHQPDGSERMYEYIGAQGSQEWQVRGVNVLVYSPNIDGGIPISASDAGVGLNEAELEELLELVKSTNANKGTHIMVVDDRDWWEMGQPLPYEENVIIE
jgi:hypothetical protein